MSDSNAQNQQIPALEWIVALLGLALVCINLAQLGWRAMQEQSPPQFAASIDSIEQLDSATVVMLKIENYGGTPVANLRIEASFAGRQSTQEAEIDYLPSHSSRRVGFITNPSQPATEVDVKFISFNEP